MRILYFLEPFPVRRRPLDYLWVADRWASALADLERRGATVCWASSDALGAQRCSRRSSKARRSVFRRTISA